MTAHIFATSVLCRWCLHCNLFQQRATVNDIWVASRPHEDGAECPRTIKKGREMAQGTLL